jgi:integrase
MTLRSPTTAIRQILVLGLRKGEVIGLTWQAVDLERAELETTWQLQRVRGELLHRQTKTEALDARLPLPVICVTALQVRQKEQKQAQAAAGDGLAGTGLVFITLAGTPFEPRNFNRRFETRCDKARSGRSPCTMSGTPVPLCSLPSTSTHGWPCGSCDTPRSTSR